MNHKFQKKQKSLNSSKQLSKENSAYSLISTKKTSTLTTTSSKNNSIIVHKNVIHIIILLLLLSFSVKILIKSSLVNFDNKKALIK